MRGRSILREPSGSSICAFCAHRLSAARPIPHVQRRLLQSSRPASRPPATAAAVREDEPDYSSQDFQSSSTTTNGWGGQTQNTPSSGGGFGRRPAFGNGIASAPSSSTNGSNRPTFGTGAIELTEDEKRARDLIRQTAEKEQQPQPRRPVDVFEHPNPESTRAGRPLPSSVRRLISARNLDEPDRRSLTISRIGTTSRRIVLDNSSSQQDQNSSSNTASSWSRNDDTQIDGRAAGWNHLRRRGNDAINEPVSSENRFSIGRSDREERGTKARYTPLSLRPGFGTRRPETQGSSYDTKPATSMLNAEEDISKRASTGLENNATSSQTSDTTVLWRPKTFGLPSKYTPDESVDRPRARFGNTFGDARNSLSSISGAETMRETPKRKEEQEKEREREREQEREREKEVERERERDREERQRKRAERYAAEEASRSRQAADQPRGRDKEKARRREQFVEEWDDDAEAAAAAKAELKRQRKRDKAAKKAAAPTPIFLPEYISVANLATALRVRIEDFIYKMEELGFEETGYDHVLNGEDAGLIAMEYNFEPIIDRGESEDLKARAAPEDPSSLPQRPPVVTIMGHVDHGKTTLLDYLRKSSVAATEHGGITQHIGAFSVPMPSGKTVTFLDTPGHAAFLSMRQRGANVTDIVILVVAADDSVKPQTIEAINHAKAAKVPMIVAINKVDKEEANIERVKQDLARHGVEIEDFGGDTQVVCVSGQTGQGMDELEETVVTLSEILDMRAETDGQAEGWVLEASVKSMGKVATVLVRRGTMRPGDFIVAGNTWARIRCLRNEAGIEINEAGPGTPVQVDGWREQPLAGDEVLQAPTESKAKSVIDYRLEKDERDKMAQDMEAINDARKLEQEKRERDKIEAQLDDMDLEAATPPEKEESGPKQVYFIIKGDVSGSVEAVIDSINGIGNGEVQPHILRSGVGQIAEFDVEHCAAAKGFLINFNTPIDPNIARLAEASKVRILDHNIIYRLVDDVKATLSESLPPLVSQKVLGEAEVAQVFEITVKGRQVKAVAGCKVRNGVVSKNVKVRVMRDGEKVFDGALASLKNVKKDVAEMRKGSECGMGFEGWNDFQVGDQVQCYETKEEKRYL